MADYSVGQTVTFSTGTQLHEGGATWLPSRRFSKGDQGVVTQVTKNLVKIRFNDKSFNAPRTHIEAPNGETFDVKAKAAVRKIGEKPEGDHIDTTDPRIQWIFEDAARVAKNSGHCWEYDNLCDRIGIPGRLRDLNVTVTVNGLKVTSTVKARSQVEAEQIVKEKLAVKA